MTGRTTYQFRVPDEVASLVRGLHPVIKSHIKSALQAILRNPYCGKALKIELEGLRSYRFKRYRVVYRVCFEKKELEIIAIGPRQNIYEETFRIISREK
jgi:mRNA interferase RelE/StbE